MVDIPLVIVTMKNEYHVGSTSRRQILPLMFSNSCFYHELMASWQPPKYYGCHQHIAGTSIMMNTTVMVFTTTTTTTTTTATTTTMIPKDVHSFYCLFHQCVSLTVRIIKKRVSNRRPDLEQNPHRAHAGPVWFVRMSFELHANSHCRDTCETGTEVSRE